MGHWAPKADRSSTGYDGARTATELAYKANVAANVRLGWRPVAEGCVPSRPLVPLSGDAIPPLPEGHESSYVSPRKSDSDIPPDWQVLEKAPKPKGDDHALALFGYVFPANVVQVLNTKTKMVHLSGGSGVACNCWKAGTPDVPSASAEWAAGTTRWSPDLSPYTFCFGCHGAKGLAKLGAKLRAADTVLSDTDSSKSESSSSSSSSSHKC
jgi:hypothetical protein